MPKSIYVYPKLNRAGLGNLLFPWARSEIFHARHSIPMLAPQWTQPKIGPLLRREKDKRYYTGLFRQDDYVRGFKKWWLLWRAGRIAESDAEKFINSTSDANGNSLVVFEGMEGTFDPLIGHRELLLSRLKTILNPAILKRVTPLACGPVIGVHIRHGDKFVVESAAPRKPADFRDRIPDDWFLTTIRQVRRVLGSDVPVMVFTDARPGEIPGLQELPNVQMAEENPSIVDILRLAQANIMIGASTSTFGMWSAFLGGMPSIWYPSKHQFSLTPDRPGFQITGGLDGSLPEGCGDLLRQAVL